MKKADESLANTIIISIIISFVISIIISFIISIIIIIIIKCSIEHFMRSFCKDVHLSVGLTVFTITHERVGVNLRNFTHVCLRSNVTWSWKMGHVHDL